MNKDYMFINYSLLREVTFAWVGRVEILWLKYIIFLYKELYILYI